MFLEENYIMWLSRLEGISLKKKEYILRHFKTAENFFNVSISELKYFCNKNKINVNNILDVRTDEILNCYLNEIYKKGIKYITKNNSMFPRLLKNIQDPPLGIYMIGDMPEEKFNKVGVIGARKCTQYGSMNAYKFGKELAENNVVIVSGMALGIDSMAHKGAIDAKGKTIAVLGCGVDIVYPSSNGNLRNEIIENGCIISEFPPNTAPFATNFPIRNRIISGLSDAIIVVESAKKSGTLITVGQALEQGRDIFAIPGNINNPMSQGTNDLIKECAHLLTDVEDILYNLSTFHKFSGNCVKLQKNTKKYENVDYLLEPNEKIVYDCISENPITIDEIILKTNSTIQIIQYALTLLEIKGYIQKLSGQKYIKAL